MVLYQDGCIYIYGYFYVFVDIYSRNLQLTVFNARRIELLSEELLELRSSDDIL